MLTDRETGKILARLRLDGSVVVLDAPQSTKIEQRPWKPDEDLTDEAPKV